jgi:hypothetical protein
VAAGFQGIHERRHCGCRAVKIRLALPEIESVMLSCQIVDFCEYCCAKGNNALRY